jgi:RNA polymerase sigma-70 factor (ECF subfamily)
MVAIALPFPVFSIHGNLLPRRVSNLLEAVRLPLASFLSTTLSGVKSAYRLLELAAAPDEPRGAKRDDDRRMVEEALSGDPGFEKLVTSYERMVYRVAFRFLNDESEACDVAQEVFMRVHRSLSQFRGDSSLSTWIYAITSNLSKNAIRSRKNREKVQVLAPGGEKDGNRVDFWDKVEDRAGVSSSRRLESREMSDAIQKALGCLPPDFREAVILRDLEGLDYVDIARALRMGLGTVKSRIARGRALLRETLKDWLCAD